jgi:hypothetical protein
MRSVKPHLQNTGTKMTKRIMPFGLVYHDGDQQLTLKLNGEPFVLTRDEADVLAFHLNSFVEDMDQQRKPQRSAEGVDHPEVHGEMLMAQCDDDPNPYHGDYSED